MKRIHEIEEARRLDALSNRVIGAAIAVHRALGPGLLESVYEACLAEELRHLGIPAQSQVPVPASYKGITLALGFRIDLLVADAIVVEIKAAEAIRPVHRAQLLTYLKFSGLRLGLLFNFHSRVLADSGIKRVVNDFPDPNRIAS